VGQEPLYYNALSTGRPVEGGDPKYVSRYLDVPNSPQFPFGFGLSYTTFRYGTTEINQKQLKASALSTSLSRSASKPVLTPSAEVTNTGQRPGEEVVQLYVRLQGTSVAQPVRALKGFQRVTLGVGETKKVTFDLGPEALALWNDRNQFAVEPAKVSIWIAPDSTQGTKAEVEIAP
jgi:beta-glucosidase